MELARKHQRRSSPAVELSSPAGPPPASRWPDRQFRKRVKQSPVSPEARSAILDCFDFEAPITEHSDAVILKVEKLLGYQGWPWASNDDRTGWICYKVNNILHEFLWSLGFVCHSPSTRHCRPTCKRRRLIISRFHWLMFTVIDSKRRLVISPKAGATPSPLPKCLTTPFLVRKPHQGLTYNPETRQPAY